MKVQCPKCSTSYRLPKGKAPAGGFKVRCKNCGHVINVASGGGEEAPASEAIWFVAIGTEKQGPLTVEEVNQRFESGALKADSLVWRKGFKAWLKAADVEEFADRFPADDQGDAGQVMSFETKSGGDDLPESKSDGAEEGASDPMVWQRRETSVLFSLDDYKVRKRTTQQQPALVQPETLVPVAGASPAAVGGSGRAQTGFISLDASEIRHVAEALARKKKQRRAIIFGVIGVAVIAVVAAGAYMFVAKGEKPAETVPEQVVIVQQAPAPEAPPAPQPPAPQQEAPKAQEPVAQAAPEAPAAEAPVAEEAPAAPEPQKKAEAPAPKKSAVAAKPAEPKPAAEPKPRAEAKPAPKAAAAGVVDANTLLAQYKGGRGGAADGKPADKGGGGGTASNLPAQLSAGQIKTALGGRQKAIADCVNKAGVATPARINARVVIDSSGKVTNATATGAGAAEACVVGVLRGTKFPQFRGDSMTVPFPYTIR